MNEKHEFQVGDLVRLKSVEEILALGFWFNEFGGISYPKSKNVLLLSDELKHCGDEFVVYDFYEFNEFDRVELNSPNSSVRIVNICPSVLELVEVEVEENTYEEQLPILKVGDKVRIKTHEELLVSGWEFIDGDYFFTGDGFVSKTIINYYMKDFLGGIYTIETICAEQDGIADFRLEEDSEKWSWTSYMVAEVISDEVDEELHEEDYQPYCAVVDEAKNNPAEWAIYKPTETDWEEKHTPTTWDKERIQRGFENLEMYVKGYDDGFQRALDLIKKEFGVEL